MDRITVLYQRLVDAANRMVLYGAGHKASFALRDRWSAWYRRQWAEAESAARWAKIDERDLSAAGLREWAAEEILRREG
jgi:hypothetical protein